MVDFHAFVIENGIVAAYNGPKSEAAFPTMNGVDSYGGIDGYIGKDDTVCDLYIPEAVTGLGVYDIDFAFLPDHRAECAACNLPPAEKRPNAGDFGICRVACFRRGNAGELSEGIP